MMINQTIFTKLTPAHWGILGAGAVLLMVVLIVDCILSRRRWRSKQELKGDMITAEFLTLKDLSKNAYELIEQEAERERKTKVIPKWKTDSGWGAPGSEYEGVHFKTFIASSIHILEAHALKRDKSLKARNKYASNSKDFSKSELACDVAEYLERIGHSLQGALAEDHCRQYLAFYRNARTPARECTEQEFRSFLYVFKEILKPLEQNTLL